MKLSTRLFLSGRVALLGSLLAFTLSLSAQTSESYLPAGKPDTISILAPPPLPGSPEQSAELEEVRVVCHAASSNDVAAAYSEKKFSIFNFTPAIGDYFQPGKFPTTEAFFLRVQKQ